MILFDYTGMAVSTVLATKLEVNEDIIRHVILNNIRLFKNKFSKYGEVVICSDYGSWRKDVFPNYKANRVKDKEDDDFPWDELWRIIEMVKNELQENFPYKVLNIHKCEADDIIGVLADYTNEFGNYEDVMIISADKDFGQLQKYPNISQYSYITKKFIKIDNPKAFLIDHILHGDGGDGVPNVLSPDDVFIREDIRQGRMTAKKKEQWLTAEDMRKAMGEDVWRNYQRNKKMVDLSETPDYLRTEIINSFENQKVANASKVMPFLMKKKCRLLLEHLGDFIK